MDGIAILITLLTVIVVMLLDRSRNTRIQKILNWFPAILFAYVVPAILVQLFGWDMSQVALHDWSKSFIMPGAIVLVMSALSFSQLKIIGYRPILVFVAGSFTVALFPILFFSILKPFAGPFFDLVIYDEYWKGLAPIVGSWIGGSTSMLVLKEVAECPEGLFLSILVMDNIIVNIWTLIMFQLIQKSDWFNTQMRISDQIPDFVPDELRLKAKDQVPTLLTGIICLLAVLLSQWLISSFILKVIILSIAGLLFGNFLSFWNHTFVLKIGGVFIITIMAILGLKLNFSEVNLPFSIVGFCIVWLISHYIIMTLTAYLLKLHMAWVPIASMANVGGISTAPAVTKAYNEEWMPHAILLAILSMVSGTTWGLLTIWLFGLIG